MRLISAVLDGHGGWQAAEFARRHLPGNIVAELENCTDADEPDQVAAAMQRAFQRTDRAFIDKIRAAYDIGFGDVAHVGCCALAAVVMPHAVVVANAGDCRAVVGRVADEKDALAASDPNASVAEVVVPAGSPLRPRGGSVYVSATPLSEDHNARMPRERARLEMAHPGEADIVMCRKDNPNACYVKGRLQPTRALGDAYLKHSEFNRPASEYGTEG
jgi:pyruvate dehydrogenase phosphatase